MQIVSKKTAESGLIAYNHGKINEVQVEAIENNLQTIIRNFEEMKRDLVFLLKENEELEG